MKFNAKLKIMLASAVASAVSLTSLSGFAIVGATDPNGDGEYLLNDAILIYQVLSGNYTVSNLTSLDYSKNGVITRADALQLQADIMADDIDTSTPTGDNTTVDDIVFN